MDNDLLTINWMAVFTWRGSAVRQFIAETGGPRPVIFVASGSNGIVVGADTVLVGPHVGNDNVKELDVNGVPAPVIVLPWVFVAETIAALRERGITSLTIDTHGNVSGRYTVTIARASQ